MYWSSYASLRNTSKCEFNLQQSINNLIVEFIKYVLSNFLLRLKFSPECSLQVLSYLYLQHLLFVWQVDHYACISNFDTVLNQTRLLHAVILNISINQITKSYLKDLRSQQCEFWLSAFHSLYCLSPYSSIKSH